MEPSLDPAPLVHTTRAAALQFLRTELMTGNVLLDAADSTRDHAVRARRVQSAREAYDVVARHVSKGGTHVSPEDWQSLRTALAALRGRLDEAEQPLS